MGGQTFWGSPTADGRRQLLGSTPASAFLSAYRPAPINNVPAHRPPPVSLPINAKRFYPAQTRRRHPFSSPAGPPSPSSPTFTASARSFGSSRIQSGAAVSRAHSGYAPRQSWGARNETSDFTGHAIPKHSPHDPVRMSVHQPVDLADETDDEPGSPWTPRLTHLRRVAPVLGRPGSPETTLQAFSRSASSSGSSFLSSSSSSGSFDRTPVWPRHWNRDHQARSRHS